MDSYFRARDILDKAMGTDSYFQIKSILFGLKAADVVEVRRGYWKPYESFPMAPSLNGVPCSECDMHFSPSAIPILHYCPNCGARMDKEDEHEQ